MGRAPRFLVAAWLAGALALVGASARADGLSPAETRELLSGQTITHTQDLERHRQRYVGGVTYKVLDASTGDIDSLINDVGAWPRFFPKTKSAQRVGSAGGDSLVRITQGNALVQANYTLVLHREGNTVRFWMDPNRPHDNIEDIWGFFRAEPMADGRSLVTYGILIDMGPGMLRDMFEPKVRQLALQAPEYIRNAVAERTGRHASR